MDKTSSKAVVEIFFNRHLLWTLEVKENQEVGKRCSDVACVGTMTVLQLTIEPDDQSKCGPSR